MRWGVLAMLATAACGGSPEGPRTASAPRISLVAPAAGPDDVVVAQVDGRPVWSSCVVGQLQRGTPDRATALEECIAFELLAQEAEARGLAQVPEVVESTRAAMVNALVATFEERYRTPADLGERMTKVLDENDWRRHRPELRASTYVRIDVPKDATPDADATAQAVSAQIADALAGETGLLAPHLVTTAERIAADAGATLSTENVRLMQLEALDPAYGTALFAIPEIGRVSPPVRTPWGWDVILWTDVLAAREQTREELAAEVFPDLRRSFFQVWVNQIIREQKVQIAIDSAQLEEAGP
jgi:hypothetical protein